MVEVAGGHCLSQVVTGGIADSGTVWGHVPPVGDAAWRTLAQNVSLEPAYAFRCSFQFIEKQEADECMMNDIINMVRLVWNLEHFSCSWFCFLKLLWSMKINMKNEARLILELKSKEASQPSAVCQAWIVCLLILVNNIYWVIFILFLNFLYI